jgi:GR25 family glycosyltransferase involved in LPS biosynthesis
MPACVSGRVINLDSAGERRQCMQNQIERLGWGATHQRFPAMGASDEEAQWVGLRSRGELGLWRTTKVLLTEWLANVPGPDDVLHVLEDDAILQPALAQLIEPFQTCEPRVDLLFSEALLTTKLFQHFRQLDLHRQQTGHSLLFVHGSYYLACSSSYLLSPAGARIILNRMDEMEAAGSLLPVDLAYRQLIRSGVLSAAIALPFCSTIAAAVGDSAIQTGLNASVSLAKSADLALRRLLYLQAWDSTAASNVLQELADLLAQGLAPDQQADLLVEILNHGRSHGWLDSY